MKGKIALLIGAGVLLYLGRKIWSASRILVKIQGFRISKGQLIVKMSVSNPTSISFTINSIVGEILNNGVAVTNVSLYQKAEILPHSQKVFDITVKPDFLGIFSTLKSFVQNKLTKEAIFKGTINVNGADLPIEQKIYG